MGIVDRAGVTPENQYTSTVIPYASRCACVRACRWRARQNCIKCAQPWCRHGTYPACRYQRTDSPTTAPGASLRNNKLQQRVGPTLTRTRATEHATRRRQLNCDRTTACDRFKGHANKTTVRHGGTGHGQTKAAAQVARQLQACGRGDRRRGEAASTSGAAAAAQLHSCALHIRHRRRHVQ